MYSEIACVRTYVYYTPSLGYDYTWTKGDWKFYIKLICDPTKGMRVNITFFFLKKGFFVF